MHAPAPLVYRCPICGAEVTVLGESKGDFHPRCCGKAMALLARQTTVFFCPQCGAQIMVVTPAGGIFNPAAAGWTC